MEIVVVVRVGHIPGAIRTTRREHSWHKRPRRELARVGCCLSVITRQRFRRRRRTGQPHRRTGYHCGYGRDPRCSHGYRSPSARRRQIAPLRRRYAERTPARYRDFPGICGTEPDTGVCRWLEARNCPVLTNARQSPMTAASLYSVIGRAIPCSSQTRCSLSKVSSMPGPSRLPGVKLAGRCCIPWITPIV
jgi:hypothetical protein